MDALKLRLRAKDQLHPILQELVTGYARFKGSKDWEGRSRMVGWSVISPRSLLFHAIDVAARQAHHSQRNEGIRRDHRGAIPAGEFPRLPQCRPS